MDQNKAKRLIIATTVGAVLLLVVLVIILCYQFISISVYNNRIATINAMIAECDAKIAEGEDVIAKMKEKEWIIYEARKLGYIFEGDRIIK